MGGLFGGGGSGPSIPQPQVVTQPAPQAVTQVAEPARSVVAEPVAAGSGVSGGDAAGVRPITNVPPEEQNIPYIPQKEPESTFSGPAGGSLI
jgi:hypothetical protein